mgnify:CR=1 FL=1
MLNFVIKWNFSKDISFYLNKIIIKEITEYNTQFLNSSEVTGENALFKNNDGSMEKRM